MSEIFIFGSGEIADLAKFYFDHDSPHTVRGFCIEDRYVTSTTHCGLPLVPLSKLESVFPPSHFQAHVALSYRGLNTIRERWYLAMKDLGYTLVSYVSSKCTTFPDLEHGDNCFILEDQTIQPTVKIGSNVMLWSGNHVGHGACIDDHCYISSHVVLCGHASIGKRCFIGVNASVRDFTRVGSDCFITMGANVTSDIGDGAVVLGAKSVVLDAEDPRNQRIMKGFFGDGQ